MERIRTHLCYANIMATIAVVFAMTGGAIAATGGLSSSSSIKACAASNGVLKLQTGKKCKKGQKAVAWNQQGVAGPKGATGPSGIAGLNGAAVPNATNATTAVTANNALALGGIPASGITHSACDGNTGQVRGFAMVSHPKTLAESFQTVDGAYNCSGQPVEILRGSAGFYVVRFLGNPSEIAVATVNEEEFGNAIFASVESVKPGEWIVLVWPRTGAPLDERFDLMVP
jgi:hypothetical protein